MRWTSAVPEYPWKSTVGIAELPIGVPCSLRICARICFWENPGENFKRGFLSRFDLLPCVTFVGFDLMACLLSLTCPFSFAVLIHFFFLACGWVKPSSAEMQRALFLWNKRPLKHVVQFDQSSSEWKMTAYFDQTGTLEIYLHELWVVIGSFSVPGHKRNRGNTTFWFCCRIWHRKREQVSLI